MTVRPEVGVCALVLGAVTLWVGLSGFDFSRHLVPPGQILSGGPAKDGIPAILKPKFLKIREATFLAPDDRVMGVVVNGQAHAYPLKILNWHEVIDDTLGGEPVAVTYCPLTQSPIVYDRQVGKGAATFAVSGQLYQSNLLLYDKKTESLWSQILGEAVAGPMVGQKLQAMPSVITTWATWRKSHPDTLVLDENTGYSRNYRIDPYADHEKSDKAMFPVSELDSRLPAKTRILGVTVDGQDEAFPFSRLAEVKPPVQVELGARTYRSSLANRRKRWVCYSNGMKYRTSNISTPVSDLYGPCFMPGGRQA